MKRNRINLLAVATILVGGWVLSFPTPATASASGACCKSADEASECCGNYCLAGTDWCWSCSGDNCL